MLTLTPLSQSVLVVLEVPAPVAVVCAVPAVALLAVVVLACTPVTLPVANFLVVGVTDLTALCVLGVPSPVIAVTESPLALTAPPLAEAPK